MMVKGIKAATVVALGLCLLACGKVEHTLERWQKKWSSPDPDAVPVSAHSSEQHDFTVHTLLTDLYLPWALAVLPGGDLLITEKSGGLYRYDPDTGERRTISGLPDSKVWGQGGFMDVLPHPQFDANRWLYFTYTKQITNDTSALEVSRAKLADGSLVDQEVLFTAEPAFTSGAHFGSDLVFDDQGYLFITSGERGSRESVQRLDNHIGKIIRLHDDGGVPEDNPFVGTPGARPEIFTLGHRNPQGIGVEPVSREIWSVEHGPRGGDEINHILPGRNYGWPVITYGREYDSNEPIGEGTHKAGMEQPLYYYVPSIGTSGMTFYTGDAFPEWKNSLFIGSLSKGHLNRVSRQDDAFVEEQLMEELSLRIRDVAQGREGFLYVIADSGELLQLRPAE